MRSLDLLFATMPIPGHVVPLLPIARALVSRGHGVRWCTGRAFEARIVAAGAEFVAMDPATDHNGRNVSELFPERARLTGVAKLRYDMIAVFFDPVPAQVADLSGALDEQPAGLVLHDAAHVGASVLESLGGPRAVTVGVTPMMLPAPDVPPFGLGLKYRTGPLARVRNAAVRALLDNVVFKPAYEHRDRIFRELGAPTGQRGLTPGVAALALAERRRRPGAPAGVPAAAGEVRGRAGRPGGVDATAVVVGPDQVGRQADRARHSGHGRRHEPQRARAADHPRVGR